MGIFDRFHKKQPEPVIPGALEQFGCTCRLLEDMSPEQLVQCYLDALEQGRREGFTPVIVPDDETLADFLVDVKEEVPIEEARAEADETDGRQLLAERLQEAMPEEDCEELHRPDVLPDTEPGSQTFYASELRREEKMRLYLVHVPTDRPWEAVLYIPFGGWNDCPLPEEMAAILRYWYEQWGAVPAVITHDVLELYVPEPVPEDRAWEVAEEHFAFTTDAVWQGIGSLEALADSIRKSTTWFFWWD